MTVTVGCLQLAGVIAFAVAGLAREHRRQRWAVAGATLIVVGVIAEALTTVAAHAARLDEPLVVLAVEYLATTHAGRLAAAGGLLAPVIAALGVIAQRRLQLPSMMIAAIFLGSVALLIGLRAAAGHAMHAPAGPEWAVPLQIAHVLCAVVWAGLVASLIAEIWAPAVLSARLARAGAPASLLVLGIAVSGPALAWAHGLRAEGLLDGPYGLLVLAKSALFLVALALAGLNRWRLVHAHANPGATSALLVSEGVVIVVVLALAAWLASAPPPH